MLSLFHGLSAPVAVENEFSDDVISETAASEILHTDGTTVHIILKDILEILSPEILMPLPAI